ncbi:glycosyltransferase [Sphingobacterium faecium]|uniref:glycosyltransferase n=1 Tax=Sphingobacterium TaxID=28453 RepID=UPI0016176735|nr:MULTISPECIES: glycosyltransferase [Sphingobacterium]MBB2954367.1 glycosyltransferase involved in cell wall biosynthesis [Sphingobacterium sp. JUb56]UXD69339.1 glycosyltransferase [Sphingobacterium faecium]
MKPKVLIVYNKIWSYREKIFELIDEEFDLTVGYSDEKFVDKSYSFKTRYLPVKKVGPFEIHKDNLSKIASQYDVIIGISNIRWISLMLLCLKRNRKFKIGYWGIGVTASYENNFDSKKTWDNLRYFISKRSDFTIFYSSYPLERYIKAGIRETKLFVAHNTTQVELSDYNPVDKKDFLFLGTLYPQKGLNELLEAYSDLYEERNDCPRLLIVGDGPEKQKVLEFIKEKNMMDKIVLFGSIYDPKALSKIFNQSIVCISPNQAGLSVLNSMGNRTSFVTRRDAITGGEIFNIENRYNGIIYDANERLSKVMEWIVDNSELVHKMNNNAYDHYITNRTPTMMANAIKKAITDSLN